MDNVIAQKRVITRENGITKSVSGCLWCDFLGKRSGDHGASIFVCSVRNRRDIYPNTATYIDPECPLPTEPIQEDPRL